MFSYDRSLKKIVLRQFHREEFVTVRIENIPAGWNARKVRAARLAAPLNRPDRRLPSASPPAPAWGPYC